MAERNISENQAPETPAEKKPVRRKLFGENLNSILVAIGIALLFRTFLFAAYKIPSGSMIPTLLVGDQLIVNKVAYGLRLPFSETKLVQGKLPEHGDVMVFLYPVDPSIEYIKRVIGLPGDHVVLRGNSVSVNGEVLPRQRMQDYQYQVDEEANRVAERYLERHGDHAYQVLYDPATPWVNDYYREITVPADHYFMMGDNRDRSNDSRYWGVVHRDLLVGAPVGIHFSWDSLDTGVRYKRMFTGVD